MLARLFLGNAPSVPTFGRVAREISPYMGYVEHPGHGVTPETILACFREAEWGNPTRQVQLNADLREGDAHLRNLFDARRQSVASKSFVILSSVVENGGQGNDAELAAYVLREAHRDIEMVAVFDWLLTYAAEGWSACEIEWGLKLIDGRLWIVPVAYHPVAHQRFRFATAQTPGVKEIGELRLYTSAKNYHGEPLEPGRWIVVKNGEDIARAGLMRTAAFLAMAKRFGFRDWVVYSEKYGLPVPIASYDTLGEHADDEAIDIAEQIVRNVGSDKGAVVPSTIKLDFKEAARAGDSSGVHGGLISHCNREMSKLVVNGTLTNDSTDSGGASYALGEVHASGRWDAVQYDAAKLQSAFKQDVFRYFCHFNGLGQFVPEMKIQVVRNLDPKQQVDIADAMTNKLGIPVSVGQLRTDTGMRAPTDAKDTAAGAPPAPREIGVAA